MKKRLGRQEMMLLAYTQMRKLRTLRTGELTGPLQLSRDQERELFRRMARGNMIARVRPGLYLVPPRMPLGGAWTPTEAEALNAMMDDAKGRYQICGANAFNLYGFDDQMPARVYAYNNRISGERQVGAMTINLIKVADERLGDTQQVGLPDGEKAVYASRVRALVDAVYDWSRFNGIPRGYRWIRLELKAKQVSAAELVRCALRYGNTGTIRRIGALLESDEVEDTLLRKLERALKPTRGPIPWVPTRPKRGVLNNRWGVIMNHAD